MKIIFDITKYPDETSNYNLSALTEATLEFWVHGERFLQLEEWPIVEFAIVVRQWLHDFDEKTRPNLYYVSMDDEEEPILALRFLEEDKRFEVDSCWAEQKGLTVSEAEAKCALSNFVSALKNDLDGYYSGNVSRVIDGISDASTKAK